MDIKEDAVHAASHHHCKHRFFDDRNTTHSYNQNQNHINKTLPQQNTFRYLKMTTQYAAAHVSPKGPGDARPKAREIVANEELEGKWSDKTVLITGVSSGIGIETSRALFKTGATLYLTARNLAKAKTALSDIVDSDRVHLIELDLNSLASVRKCVETFLAQSKNLNLLIANAGVMATPEGKTADGFETQWGTNHLAHFLLIQLLLPTLQESAKKSPGFASRVVVLTSSAHRDGPINWDDFNYERPGTYHPWAAYAQSKLANLYTATEIERRYGGQGVHAWGVHPGLILTGLLVHIDEKTQKEWSANPEVGNNIKDAEQGAATTVWAATAKALEGKGGKYLENCGIAGPAPAKFEQHHAGHAPNAYDEEAAKKLWEKTVEILKPFSN
ncbi:NAD(P)-binding protein [Plenodomus tracheiphilus IPT5]|uniref:NAD(P)-binding protein n=1 Tax=Plenodomus tracheiphilus IPT5 TaxID=1408161 RepID=A0A6A7AUC7_9PLEO|nr:NAD(P)-binding protein [Plenodomus tracheiphilus IPT5]